ncbi:Arginine biosynthesis bifunctional protein ArgJ, mitochondrial [Taphrina deformans PYCC 5710]|uniref:Arginine biosynthesis bifunctional protein ArgJ, mitochondrial n=1 Tax=Taphrina deformans (strain PYCC 5710 / ATCC 11124 / CBS 356.35 / IMI 108563 / JCM 9778 / NBRC 8474) TaxID=1097556 RepID=R4XEH0_TAPDE|nr:Arginine biosynthesis bifunctional protein ArgJ, mitochondrial [Taphrina deformans PYCC 5710]|eukprot:CCG81767.1 Arginine biosynthesis bifunctional protein ArgJ, mitochondrial [Taphrina deformans PYCC 5710]
MLFLTGWRQSLRGQTPRSVSRLYSSSASAAASQGKSRFVPQDGTYPRDFKVSGIHCGVKKNGKPDLSVVVSDSACNGAAVFTKNVFQAAPVTVSRQAVQDRGGRGIRGIVTSSGCANAVTGAGGMEDARSMAQTLDAQLEDTKNDELLRSLVMSTGVIGQRLPIDKILSGIPKAYKARSDTHEAWLDCAKAFCTTDTFPKLLSRTIDLPDRPGYRIAGITKGAGMIHPNMATLLGFIATDAPVSPDAIRSILKHAVDRSFNAISVDGDMSTNDTIALLANGSAGGPEITESSDGFVPLRDAVTAFAIQLAQLVVRDGEGATKFVTVRVRDARSFADAKQVASTIATSALVKTALYGQDANWGRILCATGYAGVPVEPFRTNVSFVPTDGSPTLALLVNGEPESVDEARASEILAMEDLELEVSLGTGGGHSASYWTCDFSHEYVTINSDYRS